MRGGSVRQCWLLNHFASQHKSSMPRSLRDNGPNDPGLESEALRRETQCRCRDICGKGKKPHQDVSGLTTTHSRVRALVRQHWYSPGLSNLVCVLLGAVSDESTADGQSHREASARRRCLRCSTSHPGLPCSRAKNMAFWNSRYLEVPSPRASATVTSGCVV